ncbi:MAG: hypothetical protein KJ941_10540 [Bacteroidetes bacterium]|nr:hypothetical protein [Bacteroidota bacterium]
MTQPTIPVPKKLTVPSGQLNTSHLSINELYSREKDKSNSIAPENLPRESFSTDQMKMLWKQFAFQMKEKGKDTVYHAMNKRNPVLLDGCNIQIEIDNIAQEGSMQRINQDLLDFLRDGLKNYDIQLQIILADNPEMGEQSLMPKDQFTALARKFPNLHSFRSAFNLDFDS